MVSDCLETKRDGPVFLHAVWRGAGRVSKRVEMRQEKRLSSVPWLTNLKKHWIPGKSQTIEKYKTANGECFSKNASVSQNEQTRCRVMALQHGTLSENRPMEAESKVEEILLVCRGLELEKADKKGQAAYIESQNILGCKGPQKSSLAPGLPQDNPKNHIMCLRPLSKHSLNYVSLGAVTTCLGILFQCLATIWMKSHSIISNLNLPWCSFWLLRSEWKCQNEDMGVKSASDKIIGDWTGKKKARKFRKKKMSPTKKLHGTEKKCC